MIKKYLLILSFICIITSGILYMNTVRRRCSPNLVSANGQVSIDLKPLNFCRGQYAIKVTDLDPETELKMEVSEKLDTSNKYTTTTLSTVMNNDVIKVNLHEDKQYSFYDPNGKKTHFNLQLLKNK